MSEGDDFGCQGREDHARGMYRALGDNGNPGFTTVVQVLAALGMRLDVKAVACQAP